MTKCIKSEDGNKVKLTKYDTWKHEACKSIGKDNRSDDIFLTGSD
jgi:hypothetical protein